MVAFNYFYTYGKQYYNSNAHIVNMVCVFVDFELFIVSVV